MKIRFVLACAAAISVLAAGAVSAMDEQRMAAPPQTSAAPAANAVPPQTGVVISDKEAKASEGTEISIPGIGKLGTLPKMDFGLDLLYGAAESRQLQPTVRDPGDPVADDLTIRGSVKHRF